MNRIEGGMQIRDREGTLFRVLFVEADEIFMQMLGTGPDVIHTRTIKLEDFEKHGYSVEEG